MEKGKQVYKSNENKTVELANCYLQTHQAPYRYLAYRDIPALIHQFSQGRKTLDFGSGTGASSEFLHQLRLEVVGVDVSWNMLQTARANFHHLEFFHVDEFRPCENFDLVFSSFVLLEMSSQQAIIQYLTQSFSFLKEGGTFIGITVSEQLFSPLRRWRAFNVNFEETKNLKAGDSVKIELKDPKIEFYDYYWTLKEYLDCFKKAHLEILHIHSPIGLPGEKYSWKDENKYSPFTIFVAKKSTKTSNLS